MNFSIVYTLLWFCFGNFVRDICHGKIITKVSQPSKEAIISMLDKLYSSHLISLIRLMMLKFFTIKLFTV